MCKVLDKLENRGIQKGTEQGIEQGMQKGIEQDRKEILLNMQGKGLSVNKMADYTGLRVPKSVRYLGGRIHNRFSCVRVKKV